jgi:uncharacterized membrane protein
LQAPILHALTLLAFALHIGGGAVGLVSGTVAVIARKGARLHRKAGTVFVISMVVMALFGCYLGFVIPDRRVNVFISVFASVLAVAAIGDAKVVLAGGISGISRISRHLWRMCLGLTLAAGSGFTNGFARLLPGPYHVPTAFFLPQFIPLGLLAFWMIRVRLPGWVLRVPAAQGR